MSLIEPINNCPTESPSRQAVNVSCARDAPVCKSSVNFGKEGKYISIDNGPIAVSVPNTRIIHNLFVFTGLYTS